MRGARQHNLKGFDLEIPRRSYTVITGPSGSGQILARLRYDLRRRAASVRRVALGVRATVPRAYGEARRRLDRRPLASSGDRAEEPHKTSRSTVGTATEIYDYLRLLWAGRERQRRGAGRLAAVGRDRRDRCGAGRVVGRARAREDRDGRVRRDGAGGRRVRARAGRGRRGQEPAAGGAPRRQGAPDRGPPPARGPVGRTGRRDVRPAPAARRGGRGRGRPADTAGRAGGHGRHRGRAAQHRARHQPRRCRRAHARHRAGAADPGALYVGGGGSGAVARGADGTLAFPTDRTVTVRRPDGTWERHSNRIGPRQSSAEVAVAPDGRIGVVATTHPLYGEVASYGGVSVAELKPGARRFGPPRALPVRKRQQEYTRDQPRIAVEPASACLSGDVTWMDADTDPGEDAEEAVGRVIAYRNGKRHVLDRRAANVTLAARADGVLALSDLGAWRSWLLGPGAHVALTGPAGTPRSEVQVAVAPSRTVVAWRGAPDGGIRAAFLPAE